MPAVTDQNSDPGVVEFDLRAAVARKEYRPGKTADVWAYNGTVPGPLVDAKVGDQLRIHFRNELPEPTTIHWHGLRVPAAMDGTAVMQTPVASGEGFEYQFTLKDPGLYWFHPHVRSDVQVEKGLYGVIRVRDPNEPAGLGRERVLVLDDVLLDADGTLGDSMAMGGMSEMTGLEGNVLLVNGAEKPTLDVARGERLRLRIVNVANARYFNLSIGGRQFHLIGGDGGPLGAPRAVTGLLLAPGERADIVIDIEGGPDDVIELVNEPYDRGHSTGGGARALLLKLRITAEKGERSELPASLATIVALPSPVRIRNLVLTEEMGGMSGMSGMATRFMINGEAFPNITPLNARLGDVEEWTVTNDTEMDHPFHLHGFFFQVIRRAAESVGELEWKDTVNVRAKSTLTFRVAFDERPGSWLFHCHILEHAERGMVGELVLTP